MPNPDRPQYQEVIASTWGLAVADTVVRRYASTAERDSDLAGFAPNVLAGQLVAILGVLYLHDGAAWRPLAPGPAPPKAVADPFASYTDAGGQLWVARGGVNGGAWRLARDVLYARAYRAVAWTCAAAVASLPLYTVSTASDDAYGMFTGGALKVPVAGLWRIEGMATVASQDGSWVVLFVYINGAASVMVAGPEQASGGANIAPLYSGTIRLAANASVGLVTNSGPVGNPGGTGNANTWLSATYVGTG